MRNSNRIPKILKEVEKIWKLYPELRLGQLIDSCMYLYDDYELFYIGDEELIKVLKTIKYVREKNDRT